MDYVKKNEASPVALAYLQDRVSVSETGKQHYGTQASCQQGRAVFFPIIDEKQVEQQHRVMHLPPLKEYLRMLEDYCQQAQQGLFKAVD